MKKRLFSLLTLLCVATLAMAQTTTVAITGNSYITSAENSGVEINKQGIVDWTNSKAEVSTYFKLSQTGELNLALRAKCVGQSSKVRVRVGESQFDIFLTNTELKSLPIGRITVADTGYVKVIITGLERNGDQYGVVEGYEISGKATEKGVVHCGTFEPYWANRGPSVHLKYTLPTTSDTEYFYNEVTVRPGNDPIGSYFMACGFGEGYFGMQVNSESERRILFSVWSPFETEDPTLIPESHKIKLIERGEGVTIGEFGNEGSGGQSFLRYNWITGNTYKFLMQVRPDGKGNTLYTARLFAPERGEWQLIASFLRPQTNTYYTNAHSFLENFIPNQGYITRRVEFSNQWACSKEGVWSELTEAMFTYDATARAGARMDYRGGVTGDNFFLQNCGFFNESTPFKSMYTRQPKGVKPNL